MANFTYYLPSHCIFVFNIYTREFTLLLIGFQTASPHLAADQSIPKDVSFACHLIADQVFSHTFHLIIATNF